MPKNPRLIDLTGQRFGLWTVIEQAGNTSKGGALWRAQCDCGNIGTPLGGDLRRGKSTSCGCLQRFAAGSSRVTHGESRTRLHRIWKAMRTRCNNPDASGYNRYGGVGITVCAEWDDFAVFREWAMSNGYADDLSIDRIDNDKGYSPDNCRWASAETQSQNRRFVHKMEDGTPWAVVAKRHGIPVTLMHSRIHEGWPIWQAATRPKGSRWR